MPASKRLVTAVTNAARAAFSEVRNAHPEEHFYVFALFSETGEDVQPTCNSEEALARVGGGKAKRQAKGSLDELRFFAEEFAYHQVGEEHFDAVTRLTETPGLDVARAALENLVREGFFGRGKARDQVAVLVLKGDQSNANVLEYARTLNRRPVMAQLERLFPVREPTKHKAHTIGAERVYAIDSLTSSADHRVLAAAGGFGGDGIFVWRLGPKPVLLLRDKVRTDSVWSIALSGDGMRLFGRGKCSVLRWDIKTKKQLSSVAVRGDRLHAFALSPDGASLACASYRGLAKAPWVTDMTLALVDATTGGERVVVAIEASFVSFSPDGKFLAYCGRDAGATTAPLGISLVDARTLEPIRVIADRTKGFRHLAFSPKSDLVAGALDDEGAGILIFSVRDGTLRRRIADYTKRASGIAFSLDGAHIAAALDDGNLRVWDVSTGAPVLEAHGKHESLNAVTFLDARHIAASGRDVDNGAPVTVWELPRRKRT